MTNQLDFYTNPQSRGRIARWMLEESGMEYTTHVVEYGPEMKSAQYLAINPMGKVPAIVHAGNAVTETAAICAYLADAFPKAKLAPPVDQRADYYRWLFFTAGPFEAATTNNSMSLDIPEEKTGMIGYGTFENVMDAMEKKLDNDGYICGDQFTAADVYIGAQIGFGLQFGSIDKRPAFESYFARVSARDAYKRAGEMDDALVKVE